MPINGAKMDIFCENCQKNVGKIADEKIPVGKKLSVACPKCGEKIHFAKAVEMSGGGASSRPPVSPPARPKVSPATPAVGAAADYDFTAMDVIREAWQKTSGAKGPIWGATLLLSLAFIFINIVVSSLLHFLPGDANMAIGFQFASKMITSLAFAPVTAGIMMIAIRRAVDYPINFKVAFNYFAYLLPILLAAVLTSFMTILGFMLLVIPGIYLSVSYLLVLPLIVDKDMGTWEAMEASRKAIHKCWFRVFGIYFLMMIIYMLSVIPLGIGLIWTMPMFIMVGGILYRRLFGVSEKA